MAYSCVDFYIPIVTILNLLDDGIGDFDSSESETASQT
jgi:hypothetical protein